MKLLRYIDDLLFIAGCVCVEVGLSMISIPLTWIFGGVMLIFYGVIFAKKMSNDSK